MEKNLKRAAKALLNAGTVEHKRPKPPTKADLNRKFVMRVDAKGKPSINEV